MVVKKLKHSRERVFANILNIIYNGRVHVAETIIYNG
jgi:hypothetical protein